MEPSIFFLIVAVTLIVSFLNLLIGGGGGLVLVPFLIYLGLTPQEAVANAITGFIGATISASYRFWKGKQIRKEIILPLAIVGTVGCLLGAQLMVNLPADTIQMIIAIGLLLMVPLIFFKDIGVIQRHTSPLLKKVGWVMLFLACFFSAMTGGGGGIMVGYALVLFFGFTFIQANANQIVLWLFVNIFLSTFFYLNGLLSVEYLIPLIIGNTIGAYVGAHTAIKKGNRFVKTLFSIVIVILALKLLFF